MKINKRKLVIWGIVTGLVLLVTAGWVRHRQTKLDMRDLKAALAARHVKEPDERLARFLEARYGSLTNSANREKAFLNFFDVDHGKSIRVIVEHTPKEQRKTNILATARWIANYRNSLTPEEAASLKAKFSSPAGQTMVQQATAQYLTQSAEYRDLTAPVISELLSTFKSLQNQ